MERITVAELLKMEVDIDVYDDYTEELGIAFCGPVELTEEGQKYFEPVLNLNVAMVMDYTGYTDYGVVEIDELDNPEEALDMLCKLFNGLAGYCSDSLYKLWFKEV